MSTVSDEATRQRRLALGAGFVLFTLLAGHTVLEVARDALFLAQLPASDLPLTYLAIALAAWVAVQVDRRLAARIEQRRLAMLTLVVASLGTVGFYIAFASETWWVWFVPHLFYVFAGLVSTFAVTQFWRLLAELFTVSEARSVYSRIAAGGSFGAIVGASLAELAQGWLEPRGLLLLGGALLALTSVIPLLVFPSVPQVALRREPERAPTDSGQLAYVRRLLLLVGLTAVTVVIVDYVFKATIATELRPEELAPFFSRFYVVLNIVSLAVQLFLAPRLLTWLGAPRALAVLPMLLLVGAAGHVTTGLFALAVFMRGSDGALRHSLHRSAFELLYLPLSKRARDRYKTLIDALGQRGGQALGSLAILLVGLLGVGPRELGVAIAALAALWVGVAVSLRPLYLDRFRANLRAGSIETRVEVPQLDLSALESVIASLNSPRDEEVLATLNVLVDYKREALIPTLLLYHPSREVVLRTLQIFATARRTDHVPLARRLLARDDTEVQAAAMNAVVRGLSAAELWEELSQDPVGPARAALLVSIVARELDREGEARAELSVCAVDGTLAVKVALALAIRLDGGETFLPYLREMAGDAEPRLARELARAYGAIGHADGLEDLIRWLGPRAARLEARAALLAIGEPALEALIAALSDQAVPLSVRAHIPRTLAPFQDERAAHALFSRLVEEQDSWISYKILRSLQPHRAALPHVRLVARELAELIHADLVRATTVLAWRLRLEDGQEHQTDRKTLSGLLLAPALREKHQQAVNRAIRLVALLGPDEDVRRIARALARGDRRRRSESRELLTALAPGSTGPVLDALLDEAPDHDRLCDAADLLNLPLPERSYQETLAELIEDRSEVLRTVASHHAGELGLVALLPVIARAKRWMTELSLEVLNRAEQTLRAALESEAADDG